MLQVRATISITVRTTPYHGRRSRLLRVVRLEHHSTRTRRASPPHRATRKANRIAAIRLTGRGQRCRHPGHLLGTHITLHRPTPHRRRTAPVVPGAATPIAEAAAAHIQVRATVREAVVLTQPRAPAPAALTARHQATPPTAATALAPYIRAAARAPLRRRITPVVRAAAITVAGVDRTLLAAGGTRRAEDMDAKNQQCSNLQSWAARNGRPFFLAQPTAVCAARLPRL